MSRNAAAFLDIPATVSPLTARMLRSFPLGEFERAVRQAARRYANRDDAVEPYRRFARRAITVQRPGRRGRDPVEYARIAQRYESFLGTESPIGALASAEGLTVASARNLVYEARKRGYLTPTVKGHAGGDMTQQARKLLGLED
jgi:hypothetical protein